MEGACGWHAAEDLGGPPGWSVAVGRTKQDNAHFGSSRLCPRQAWVLDTAPQNKWGGKLWICIRMVNTGHDSSPLKRMPFLELAASG